MCRDFDVSQLRSSKPPASGTESERAGGRSTRASQSRSSGRGGCGAAAPRRGPGRSKKVAREFEGLNFTGAGGSSLLRLAFCCRRGGGLCHLLLVVIQLRPRCVPPGVMEGRPLERFSGGVRYRTTWRASFLTPLSRAALWET